jgi:hypothetical protein
LIIATISISFFSSVGSNNNSNHAIKVR